jgi:HSP20 family protein
MMRELTSWRPTWSLGALRHDMDHIFDRFFADWDRETIPAFWSREDYAPPIESYVDGDRFVVKADLPGVDPKEIEVSVEGNHLTIKGERKTTQEGQQNGSFHREVRYGSFVRTLALPEGIKMDEVHARYDNGVLTVSLSARLGGKRESGGSSGRLGAQADRWVIRF